MLPNIRALAPAEIDSAIEGMLPRPLASSITAKWRSRRIGSEESGQWEQDIVGWDIEGEFEIADAERALVLLEQLNAPAGPKACVKALLRLKAKTTSRNREFDDLKMLYAAFTAELERYPEDVVRDACKTWTDFNIFFPSWAELRELCEERVLKRHCLLEALRSWLERQARMAAGGPMTVEDRTHYNVPWRQRRDELIQAVGEKEWRMWCEDLIPLDPVRDKFLAGRAEEATYFLAAPSRGWARHVNRLYAQTIGKVLGRPVEAVDRHWASQANLKRRAQSEAQL